MLAQWGPRLLARLMDEDEQRLLPTGEGRALALARAVAAKEAASKALGTGFDRGVRWRDLVLLDGPRVELRAVARRIADDLGATGEASVRIEERDDLVLAEVWLQS